MIKFIRKGGRVIPIRSGKVYQENMHITEVAKARKAAKEGSLDELGWAFWKYTRENSKKTGERISKRIARFAMKHEKALEPFGKMGAADRLLYKGKK